MRYLVPACALLLAAAPALAQVWPTPDGDDPRLASVRPDSAGVRLDVPVGRAVTVLLPPGEPVSVVSVASPADWDASTDGTGDAVTVRPLRPVPDTVMAVSTSTHAYRFLLSAAPAPQAPLVVRMIAPQKAAAAPASPEGIRAAVPAAVSWRLSGNRELWPSMIRDDGAKTYIEWPEDRPVPAVFSVDGLGREEMVNGYMRGTTFTIDRVHEHLLFRIDRASATARRRTGGRTR